MSEPELEIFPEEPKPRRRILVKIALYACIALVLVGAVAAMGAYLLYEHITQPGIAGEPVEVDIPQGLTGAQVGRLLFEEELVERAWFFRAAMRIDDSGNTLKHGPYTVPKGISPMQVLHLLHEGPNRIVLGDDLRITIPEGLSIAQMAQFTEAPQAFIEAAKDSAQIQKLGIEATSLEGFLMPNTYFFAEMPSEIELVERMLEQFEKEYSALLEEHPHISTEDTLRLVTVASLVEEEARIDIERPVVASVIYNRLDKGMPLEMDSTLQYALGKYAQRLLNEDKDVESPYNTYRVKGLPPGPISNPGVASLRAAMDPADTDYLFFVSNADGESHTFSSNLAEHNRAVARYRKEIREQRHEVREKQ